jgi:putative transposase
MSRFSDEQLIGFLKQVEVEAVVKDLGGKHGFSDASFH